MSKEILAIPEEHLKDVILVLKTGLRAKHNSIDVVVEYNLKSWIKQQEKYLKKTE